MWKAKKKNHEIWLDFFLLEICFSLTALIGFRVVFMTFSHHVKCKRHRFVIKKHLKVSAETRLCYKVLMSIEQKMTI